MTAAALDESATPCQNVDTRTGFHRCTVDLPELLSRARSVLTDLDVTLSRQDHPGGSGVSVRVQRTEQPLPYSVVASSAADTLLDLTITRWATLIRRATDRRPVAIPADPIGWLTDQSDAICRRAFHVDLIDEVEAAIGNAERVLAGVTERLEAGRCAKCGHGMSGRPDHPTVRCRRCRTEYVLADVRSRLLDEADERDVTATEAERLVAMLYPGERLPRGTVASWLSRDQIEPVGTRDGSPTFRFGDLLARTFGQGKESAA